MPCSSPTRTLMRRAVVGGALALLLAEPLAASAQTKPDPTPAPRSSASTFAPSNDNFASATILPGPSDSISAGQFNDGATAEAGEPQHKPGLAANASIWYRWTSPVTGKVVFRTRNTGFDTILAAYKGTAVNALTQVATNDDASFNGSATLQSQIAFQATAGTTYSIAVDSFTAATGPVKLSWTTNDDFAGAGKLLGPAPGQQAVEASDINGTTAQAGEPLHHANSADPSVWYSWTAPETATARFTTFGNEFDTVLEAFTGSSLTGLTEVASNDDVQPGSTASEITFPATKGTTYRISLSGLNGKTGFTLLRYQQEGPSITIGDATVFEGNSGTTTLKLPVKLSKSSPATVKVSFATVNGTATAGSDFVAKSGTLTFLPGETSKNVGIAVNGDTTHENQEKFSVALSNATGGAAVIGDATGVGTINTDE